MSAPTQVLQAGLKPIGFLFALTAVLAYATAQVLTRHGVSGDASPILGSFIALTTGTLGFTLIAARQLRERAVDLRKGAWLFALAGFFSTLGVVFQFQALHEGEVTLVSPISNTNPLFTLIFATVLLRGVERLTPRVFLGAGLVVAGVVVLRLG
ncbi:MAG TPA: DMT family transporter [Dehalococcoidia bacterium]|nr:DMT family transporter [Dehalococcoidia bacterium]